MKFLIVAALRAVPRSRDCVKEPMLLDWRAYVMRIAPIGVAASLDIALSQWSLEYITISL